MIGHRTYLDPRPHRPSTQRDEDIIEAVLRAKRRGYGETVRVVR